MQEFTWRALFERGCLAGWMILMTVNTVIFGLAVELLVFGTIFSYSAVMLINERTVPFLLYGVLAAGAFPLVARMHTYGVDYLNFEIHETAMNRMMTPPESWSDAIMALLDEAVVTSNKLELLVQLIDEAPGPVERQERRAEAKAWLKENREKLTDEDREFARERLGYLWSSRGS